MGRSAVPRRLILAMTLVVAIIFLTGGVNGDATPARGTDSPLRLAFRVGPVAIVPTGDLVVTIPPAAPLCAATAEQGGGRALVIPALDATLPPGECTPSLWRRGELQSPTALLTYSDGLPDRKTTVYLLADPGAPLPAAGVMPPADAEVVVHRPVARLPHPPSRPGQEVLLIPGNDATLYRWPSGESAALRGWNYGAVPFWRNTGLIDLREMDPTLRVDLRYANSHNFLGEMIYPEAVPLLRREAARALVEANQFLHRWGLGLLVWDAYRPLAVQRLMWAKVPDRRYVADPAHGGSAHNRGTAVDVTLVTIDGTPLAMPTDFDDFTPAAAHTARDELTNEQLFNRAILRLAMELHGFRALRTEWWHYTYPLDNAETLDVPLE